MRFVATPRFTVLAVAAMLLVPPAALYAADTTVPLASNPDGNAPQITYVSEGARHWEACYLFGEGFQGRNLKVLAWDPKDNRPAAAVVAEFIRQGATPSAVPPAEARLLTDRLRAVSPQTIGCIYRDGWIKVLWVQTADGTSRPYVTNRPRMFFLDHETVEPGQVVRIVGRNLVANLYQPKTSVWLAPADGGEPIEADVGFAEGDFQNHLNYEMDYVLRVQIPGNAPSGSYRAYVYVGQAGALGVAGPLNLTVAKPQAVKVAELPVAKFGADGSGTQDDTESVLKAISEAARQTPARVLFGPGTYLVSRPIQVPPGVSLVGPGWQLATLRANPDRPFELKFPVDGPLAGSAKDYEPLFRQHRATPLIHVIADTTITGLRIETGHGCSWGVLGAGRRDAVHNVVITQCWVEQGEAAWISPKTGWVPAGGCLCFLGPTQQCTVSHCELRGVEGMSVIGPALRCLTSYNHYKPTIGRYGTSGMGWLLGKYCIVEYNHCEESNRGFTCGPWFGPLEQNLIYRNQVVDGGSVEGAGESALFEGVEAGSENWFGRPAAVGPDWLEVPEARLKPDQLADRFVVVMAGRGFGGFRRILSNTDKRITLSEPWTVQPDTQSQVVARQFFFENIILNQYGRDTLGGIEFFGGGLENVVEHFVGLRTKMGVEFNARQNVADTNRLVTGPEYHTLVRGCRFDDGMGINLGASRMADQMQQTPPLLVGQRFVGCEFNRATSIFNNSVLETTGGSVHWLPKAALLKVQSPPACRWEVFSGCHFQAVPGAKPLDFESGYQGMLFWDNSLNGQKESGAEHYIEGATDGAVGF
ncbi:MAG TPA: glycosyl hydrolase family 28-related protein [Planctomycetota bacterium]|nr:glycosyl hydrolase family 28-related protein [Planctomycetota bacterium]